MIAELLDRVLVWFVRTLSYVAVGLVVGLWSLVILALVVNLYKLFV